MAVWRTWSLPLQLSAGHHPCPDSAAAARLDGHHPDSDSGIWFLMRRLQCKDNAMIITIKDHME